MKSILAKLLLGLINPELIQSLVQIALQFIRAAIVSTETQWDDKNILPIIDKLDKLID